MNLPNYTDAMVAGIPIVVVVIGLVQLTKSLGLAGKWLYGVSMLIGLLFGGGFVISNLGVPETFSGWFTVIVYGTGMGLVACGLYDAAARVVAKGNETKQ